MTTPTPTPAPIPPSYGDQLRDLWRTRPSRPTAGRKVAGVCAGIGARYDVDPLLIRVAFAVATIFGGVGIALYLVAWVCFPRQGEAFELRGGVIVGMVVVAMIVSGSVFDSGLTGSGAVALVAMLGGWWLLHQRTPIPPLQVTATPASAVAGAPVDMTKPSDTTAPDASATPPSWDPLGAAPFAWDLPDPTAPASAAPAQARKTRRWWPWIAVGMVVTLVSTAFAVGLLVFVFTGPNGRDVTLGDREYAPQAGELTPTYTSDIGNLSLDLTGVTLASDRTVRAQSRLGNVSVVVPEDMRVMVDCSTGAGDTSCSIPPGPSTGPLLTLDVRADLGDVTVTRR